MDRFSTGVMGAGMVVCLAAAQASANIVSLDDLQNMKTNLSCAYVLMNAIDAAATTNWNELTDAGAWSAAADYSRVDNVSHDLVTHNGTNYYALRDSGPSSAVVEPGVTEGWTNTWLATALSAGHCLGFEPVGSLAALFGASFDGQGFTISNLYINRPETDYVGLFGYSYGLLANVTIEARVVGNKHVGILVGYTRTATNCHTAGHVQGKQWVGGLASDLIGTGHRIDDCSSSATVVSEGADAAGLVAYGGSGTQINRSFATGNITAAGQRVGGLVGETYGTINNCYARGRVISTTSTRVGGLIGQRRGNITNSYATGQVDLGGGFAGNYGATEPPVDNNFWDTETSVKTTSAMGTGKTTAEMKSLATFTDLRTLGLGAQRTGTASADAAGAAVTGAGTAFTIEFSVGDRIRLDSGEDAEIREIAAIADDENLTVTEAFGAAHAGVDVFMVAETDRWSMELKRGVANDGYPALSGTLDPVWYLFVPPDAGAIFTGR